MKANIVQKRFAKQQFLFIQFMLQLPSNETRIMLLNFNVIHWSRILLYDISLSSFIESVLIYPIISFNQIKNE